LPVLEPTGSESASLERFNTARRRAFMQDILAEISGRPDDLLSFDEVHERLRLREPTQGIRLDDIPLDKIVGSVGRYRDFNRAFLPRAQIDPARWAHIEQLHGRMELPPIDVFQVGEVYFVRDGNHRVSVARARQLRTIRARVVEIPVRVPLGPDTSPDDLILKSGYAEFLEKTALDRSFPEQRIELTRAGGHRSLLQHVEVHQFYMGLRSRTYPSLEEAAAAWYLGVYLPVVKRIRASGILGHFPGRTEADLYLWTTENRARLQMQYSGASDAHEAVDEFAQEHRVSAVRRWLRRTLYRLFPGFRGPGPDGPAQIASDSSTDAAPSLPQGESIETEPNAHTP
jgi:uncharacterized ParB-like nuclease family protein